MGIWTAVVCATALGAAAEQPQQPEKTRFDFEGPRATLTLASPGGVIVDAGKSRKTQGEVSLQAQDRVQGDATYGDTAELVTRFQAKGKEVEVRLKSVGFGPASGEAKKLQPKEGIEGGVALDVPANHDGGPSRLKMWGVAEVLVGGKVLTDSAVVAVQASDAKKTTVAMLIDGLPKEFAPSGRLDVRFDDAVVTIERDSVDTAPARTPAGDPDERAPAPAVAGRSGAQPATGTGGSGNAGQGAAAPGGYGGGATGTGGDATGVASGQTQGAQPGAEGANTGSSVASGRTESNQPGGASAAGAGGLDSAAPSGAGGGDTAGFEDADGVGTPAAPAAAPAPGGFDSADGVGGAGGEATGAPNSAAGGAQGASPFPGTQPNFAPTSQAPYLPSGAGAAQQAARTSTTSPPAGLSPIDYSGSTSGISPIFPNNAGQSQGFGGGYSFSGGELDSTGAVAAQTATAQPVGSVGVPAAAAASPGSTSDLGVVNGAEITPGIPASPSVLNNGRFPRALQTGSGFTPGIPASPPVLNDGRFPLGPTGIAPSPAGAPASDITSGGTAGSNASGNAASGANAAGAGGAGGSNGR